MQTLASLVNPIAAGRPDKMPSSACRMHVRRPANLSNPFACILTHMIHKLFISSTTRVDYYTKYITRHCGPNQGGYQPKHSFRLLFFNVYLFLYQFCRRI